MEVNFTPATQVTPPSIFAHLDALLNSTHVDMEIVSDFYQTLQSVPDEMTAGLEQRSYQIKAKKKIIEAFLEGHRRGQDVIDILNKTDHVAAFDNAGIKNYRAGAAGLHPGHPRICLQRGAVVTHLGIQIPGKRLANTRERENDIGSGLHHRGRVNDTLIEQRLDFIFAQCPLINPDIVQSAGKVG